ncbi:glucoamylase family protein [uncultured Bacteroides sp.]|uniref:glucoamylase family protein n=1 Tax=uncultured Bacteroides sp. TaxID=162156 RepID=UPI0025CF222B|nr:glucoamylase family protein [uncultured Bacteroides sp.]
MRILYLFLCLLFLSCSEDDTKEVLKDFEVESVSIGNMQNLSDFVGVIPDDQISITFTDVADEVSCKSNIILSLGSEKVKCTYSFPTANSVRVVPVGGFRSFASYKLIINPGAKSASGVLLTNGKTYTIKVGMDDADKFERIPDEDLLTLVQKQTFRYFWNLGHEHSGMARERSTSGDVVTTGGTGFGVMAMLVAAERNFANRAEILERIQRIVTFLDEDCTSYHGAFSHWINGATGATEPFGEKDDGADLVETAFLFQGLLAARAYFTGENVQEKQLRDDITRLWESIEWTWFQKNKENILYWHWSPNFAWEQNLPIGGWNECLITYILAASSPTYPIEKKVYDDGWAHNGAIKNGKSYYGITLPLGSEKGGPLFLSHYSFLGINPEGLKDQYADYWEQNRNHTLINYNHCVENPNGFGGYSSSCWGLTACDGNEGYSAHSPTNDKGVIAPTAALSAFPYSPEESMKALHYFYYKLGDKLWRDYGFIDAFNLSEQWYDDQYLAIDQGPIICMIENYRTGMLWKLFMEIPEIQNGLRKLGFESPCLK